MDEVPRWVKIADRVLDFLIFELGPFGVGLLATAVFLILIAVLQ